MDKKPIAFMSYAHFDDENDNKFATWFCKRLSSDIMYPENWTTE
jgi:hemolysin-activating ACP:hemolysin acyltransferase